MYILSFLSGVLVSLMGGLVAWYVIVKKRKAIEGELTEAKEMLLKAQSQNSALEEKIKALTVEYNEKLLNNSFLVQEVERRKIAAEIHDALSSTLVAVKLNLQVINRYADFNEVQKKCLDDANVMLLEAVRLSSEIAHNLHPKKLESEGLAAAVGELCSRLGASKAFTIKFDSYGMVIRKDKEFELVIFRVFQEFLNNCVKHSGATAISVEMYWDPILCITIFDNGKPFEYDFSNPTATNSFGVANLKNRLDYLNAFIRTDSGVLNKTQLFIPLHKEVKATESVARILSYSSMSTGPINHN